jgi:hypothetical protein
MKIDLYTKAVLTVIAIGIGFLVFEQKPVKEVHAGYHDNNGRLQLMNRMAKMEQNFKAYKQAQKKLAQRASERCRRSVDPFWVIMSSRPNDKHVRGVAECLNGLRRWAEEAARVN